jgi:SMODS and SLOG-associating 2TM effector domain 3/SMODS and SLOG-associating 2TM effector domain 1
LELPDSALPGLFQGADRLSLQGQNRFLLASRVRLVLIVVAAAGGAFSLQVMARFDVAALTTVIALVGAIVTEVWLLVEKPELDWYDGRALAESAKTLTWRYAVGAAPFEDMRDRAAEGRFVDELETLLREAPSTAVAPTAAPAVSNELRQLRDAPLRERRESYLQYRIDEQSRWYTGKSEWNVGRARRWRVVLLVLEAVGVVAALVRTVGLVELDVAGIVAALVGAAAAWLATKQHDGLGRAYAFAANELSLARARLVRVVTQAEWAREAADAEEAISREHTMWRASRSSH